VLKSNRKIGSSKRGDSGALNPQSATAGPNPCSRYVPRCRRTRARGVDGRARRNGLASNHALVPAREEGKAQAESVVVLHYRVVAFGSASQSLTVVGSPLEQGTIEGDSPVPTTSAGSTRVTES
jgi:hypothetical protein